MRTFLLVFGFFVLACAAPTSEGTAAGDCTDDADNDNDGLFDCNDDGCLGAPSCNEDDEDPVDDSAD